MSETTPTAIPGAVADAAQERIAGRPARRARLASVRVSPGGYLAVSCIMTFLAALLLRANHDLAALTVAGLAWVLTPILAFTDRISFDGHTLARRGLVPLFIRLVGGRKLRLGVEEIERVETSAVRTLRRNGRVRYRYRSEVAGRGNTFIFASGGNSYRQMVRTLFPLLGYDKVDARSSELRDYLTDAQTLRMNAELLRIAPPDVLEGTTSDLGRGAKKELRQQRVEGQTPSAIDVERGRLLRLAANELRAAGRLRESEEAFRRAFLVIPNDGWLVYEFARFLRSQAGATRDMRLLQRARACLRLALRRADNDAALLSRIGESFYEYGELQQATRAFMGALEANPRAFRAEIGLAEVALRNGKLAHVIHHYDAAARIAPDESLAARARREADYYSRLNDDDDYLATELRRIGWLQHLQRARRLAARMTLASILLALLGPSFDESIEGVGWSLASSSLLAWLLVALALHYLAARRKPE
ncbi:MAG TPA: tetratricopeptide repeat protein [Pyrinomonadaceae bacterium]|nr:tetratricopeptide repeat protein [Pyrinomonadaceae bacterium]